ncbi:MAG: ABC transporter ATP-binding protein [Lachnospiraceae bacterium]|nr:ABC transporter ATP-binding protein [Lachnospiraceae bacterium]
MVLLALLCSVIDVSYPLFNRYVLDHYIAEGTLQGLPVFIAVYLAVLFFQALINDRTMIDSGTVEMSVDKDLRNEAFHHLQTLSFSYFNQNSVGYIHARVMSDTGKIGEAVSWRMMDCIWNGSYILFAIVVMCRTDLPLALWMIGLLAASGLLITLFQKKLVVVNRMIRELNSRITGDFNEGITGARSIKLLGVEEKMQREFEADTENIRRESVRAVRYSAMLISTVTLMSSVALAVVLWQGGMMTREGIIRIGTLSVFVSYAVGMVEPLQFIIQNISAFIAIQVNIERLTNLLAEPAEVADSEEVVARYGDSFTPKRENWEELRGDIEFKDVTFRYPDGEENVLEHFNLKVPHGQNIAIVGETGAGKSTLVNLICRFYEPTEGVLLIDGRDARERSQLWLHSHLGYVLQTPHLFSGTVRDNLRYGRPDATDEEIIEALEMVSAADVVARMAGITSDDKENDKAGNTSRRAGAGSTFRKVEEEQDEGLSRDAMIRKGLGCDVGEGGSHLSTGEKQLLSFARALLADPKLLILDEATSSIDTLTEKAIQNAIAVVTKDRTSFVIAHRLSTITNADLILVVKDGKIEERGTHRELMKKRGYYYSLYTRQYEESILELHQ